MLLLIHSRYPRYFELIFLCIFNLIYIELLRTELKLCQTTKAFDFIHLLNY